MSSPETPVPPLRVLALDGGGIRGLSSLLILEHIMDGIKIAKGLKEVPRPCDYFDLIGGTSTGGIIAIMLGRLGMTVDECIRAYNKVAQAAFTPKNTLSSKLPAPPNGVYSANALEDAIRQTVREFCVEPSCLDQRRQGVSTTQSCPHQDAIFRSTSCTKTVVLAITKDNVDASPTLFKTYGNDASYQNCTIWQVARATSAATTFFKPIRLGRDNVEFIDAGFGYNNPCEVLIDEAQAQFPHRRPLRALSIGTGLKDIVPITESRWGILIALKTMASTSTAVASRLEGRYGDSGEYYRFNVDRGLQDVRLSDWKKTSTIVLHTGNYLTDNRSKIQKFVDSFLRPTQSNKSATNPPRATASNAPHHYIPFPKNENFVGRTDILQKLNQKLFTAGNHRRVCLHGLGGMGKTQVALQLAHEKKDEQAFTVIWLPAIDNATFQQGCTQVVNRFSINVEKDEDHREALRQYLNSEDAGKWLLVVDNLDEMDMLGTRDQPGSIAHFLRDNENGHILFTTRSHDIALKVAPNHIIRLEKMDSGEGRQYLSTQLDEASDDEGADMLLDQLTHLPLAITQAAAYMKRTGISIRKYLELLDKTESNKAKLMSWKFYDEYRYDKSQNAVALTWQVSFGQIQEADPTAAKLLAFISRVEPKAIPLSMLPAGESEIDLINAIGTLRAYAFLDVRDGHETETYDMHSVVHFATRTWVEAQGREHDAVEEAVTHLSAIFPTDDWENRDKWRQFLPHALRVLQDSDRSAQRAHLGYLVGQCLGEDGRNTAAVQILEEVVSAREITLAETHPSRLASQQALARAYQANGQVQKAVELLEMVVSIRETTLAETHPDRLASQHVLAGAYRANGKVQKAVELLEKVVSIHEITLAETHPSRLTSQHALAGAYQANGQVQKAVELLEMVVSIRETTLAETHPDRLASQQVLAAAYIADAQAQRAVEILERIVPLYQSTHFENHSHRLAAEKKLEEAYAALRASEQTVGDEPGTQSRRFRASLVGGGGSRGSWMTVRTGGRRAARSRFWRTGARRR